MNNDLFYHAVLFLLARPTKPELYQSNETLVEKSLALFICTTQGGNPIPTFTWLINQIPINDSFFTGSPNTSELRLPLEKRFHNGQLICQVNNQALDNPLTTTRILNIQCKKKKKFLFLFLNEIIVWGNR
jgi:hypothetical protein